MPDSHALRISRRCATIAFRSRGIVRRVLALANIAVVATPGRATQPDVMESVGYVRPHTSDATVWETIMMPLPTI